MHVEVQPLKDLLNLKCDDNIMTSAEQHVQGKKKTTTSLQKSS